MTKHRRFKPWMLNGHPGPISFACKRVVVRAVNQRLVVTSTSDGSHAATSFHFTKPRAKAVDFGTLPGVSAAESRARKVDFQLWLLEQGAENYHELFGPDNAANVKNGVQIQLVEGTPLETLHDTHVHVAPRLRLVWPKVRRAQRTSLRGREFLTREEGIVLHAYNDPAGHATFGVGHLIHLGPCTAADFRAWGSKSNPKTPAFAMQVLGWDLKRYEATVREAVGRRLPQHKFDALVSLAFNIGTAGFAGSTAARRVRAKAGNASVILMWDNPSILRPRREREALLYRTGQYSR